MTITTSSISTSAANQTKPHLPLSASKWATPNHNQASYSKPINKKSTSPFSPSPTIISSSSSSSKHSSPNSTIPSTLSQQRASSIITPSPSSSHQQQLPLRHQRLPRSGQSIHDPRHVSIQTSESAQLKTLVPNSRSLHQIESLLNRLKQKSPRPRPPPTQARSMTNVSTGHISTSSNTADLPSSVIKPKIHSTPDIIQAQSLESPIPIPEPQSVEPPITILESQSIQPSIITAETDSAEPTITIVEGQSDESTATIIESQSIEPPINMIKSQSVEPLITTPLESHPAGTPVTTVKANPSFLLTGSPNPPEPSLSKSLTPPRLRVDTITASKSSNKLPTHSPTTATHTPASSLFSSKLDWARLVDDFESSEGADELPDLTEWASECTATTLPRPQTGDSTQIENEECRSKYESQSTSNSDRSLLTKPSAELRQAKSADPSTGRRFFSEQQKKSITSLLLSPDQSSSLDTKPSEAAQTLSPNQRRRQPRRQKRSGAASPTVPKQILSPPSNKGTTNSKPTGEKPTMTNQSHLKAVERESPKSSRVDQSKSKKAVDSIKMNSEHPSDSSPSKANESNKRLSRSAALQQHGNAIQRLLRSAEDHPSLVDKPRFRKLEEKKNQEELITRRSNGTLLNSNHHNLGTNRDLFGKLTGIRKLNSVETFST
ncbi:uncharacterized protein MELLADRAFT_79449 [Melampsora larici-populina 98AG31]|uniref:Uncharacterized protein n=1 Tax=Melampsora larici-populina (strain 98AG31 / pathotype 3-4-7) TaxID=747676 RepID=F4S717_MELLP|nr:uncharacterized protein MELLADRAFT_79449 [Melampsora larici-populina 98AG31]EGF99558.1 hypothetical protein MELLADRAFT_79449 [Melampsora larici-populina 98AG31]